MPLIQGGPPEWIWERTPDTIRWELVPSNPPDRETRYELRVQCGLEIMRWQFFTREEIADLCGVLAARLEELDQSLLGQKVVRRALRHSAQNASLVSEPFTGKPK